MFEYFPGNYTWNMAVVTLVDEVGTPCISSGRNAKSAT